MIDNMFLPIDSIGPAYGRGTNPVLIVCYLRPDALRRNLEILSETRRRVYIFIDFCESPVWRSTNIEVLKVAESFKFKLDIRINSQGSNLGVAKALPSAVDWIFQFEDAAIILEDDCICTDSGYEFLDDSISKLSTSILLTCATSPWDFYSESISENPIGLSSYPTISGWGTTRANWNQLRSYIWSEPPILKSFLKAIMTPRKALILSFFLAAHIRVKREILEAWDSPMALGMLLNDKKSWISDKTFVENIGRDKVASHTIAMGEKSEIFRRASFGRSRLEYSNSSRLTKKIDLMIEKQAFELRKRHLLSFFKAVVQRKNDRD